MTEQIAHSGAWMVAIFMIIIASWVFYRFFAPATWREWANAGLVQAFLIALYAEMYGFPLTIYLLVRFFGLDGSYPSANLWSSLLGLGETGMAIAMFLGYLFVFVGIALFARGWHELYRARREQRLATDGLYAIMRHPQYTGLFIALWGEGVIHWPTVFSITVYPIIVVAYALLAKREEREMVKRFGSEFSRYREKVPAFIPPVYTWGSLLRSTRARERSSG